MRLRSFALKLAGYSLAVFAAYAIPAIFLCLGAALLVCNGSLAASGLAAGSRHVLGVLLFCFYAGLAFCYAVFCGALEAVSGLAGKIEAAALAVLERVSGALANRFGQTAVSAEAACAAADAELGGAVKDSLSATPGVPGFAKTIALTLLLGVLRGTVSERIRGAAVKGFLKPALLLAGKLQFAGLVFFRFKWRLSALRSVAHLVLGLALLAAILIA